MLCARRAAGEEGSASNTTDVADATSTESSQSLPTLAEQCASLVAEEMYATGHRTCQEALGNKCHGGARRPDANGNDPARDRRT